MAQSDYEAGLRGNQNFLRTGQEKLDWEAGYRAYLANKDMADRIRETDEEDRAAMKHEAEREARDELCRNDPSEARLRAAIERKIENEFSWPWFLFVQLPKFLFWQLPKFLFDAIAGLSYKPINDDDLYGMIVGLLQTMRKHTHTADDFDAAVRILQTYLDEKLKVDKKRVTSAQRSYVDSVRKACGLEAEKVRSIVDQIVVAFGIPDLSRCQSSVKELDGVFKPVAGGAGWDVFVRAASSSE